MGLILTMYKHGDGINEFRSFRAKQHMKIFTYVGPFLESTEEGVRKAEEKGAEVVLKGLFCGGTFQFKLYFTK